MRPGARRLAVLGLSVAAMGAGCGGDSPGSEAPPPEPPAPTVGVQVTGSFAHDTAAFTQGLVFHRGALYESTGQYGKSSLRRLDPRTGAIQQQVPVEAQYFAEGLAALGDRLYQLTWQSNAGFIYEVESLRRVGTFGYAGEGWGLTTDGTSLILSDGTDRLRFLDPRSFQVTRSVTVSDAGAPIINLNELEWVRGEVWANIWKEDRIARIDPTTGRVKGWIDIAGLLPAAQRLNPEAVANGIAYDPEGNTLFLTGKLWPTIFRVTVPDMPGLAPASSGSAAGGAAVADPATPR